MSAVALDRLLAVLVVGMAVTGLLTLRAGAPAFGWLFAAHGLLAGSLGLAVVLKVRSSLRGAVDRRRWARLALGLVVTFAVAAALTGGWLWVASGELLSIGSWTVLTLHAWVGLALVPLVVVHLLPRRWRLLRMGTRPARPAGRPWPARPAGGRLTRRAMLTGAAFAVASLATFGAAALVEQWRGGERRFTGSRWLPAGGVPPPTTFFGEPAPVHDPAGWRLAVRGRVAKPARLTLDELRALCEVDLEAVLDCTSGWALSTRWRGAALAAVIARASPATDARGVIVRSATGWATYLPLTETVRCLLALEVAGQPLPVANGAPLRLVVPDRRGLDWIKWVTDVEVV